MKTINIILTANAELDKELSIKMADEMIDKFRIILDDLYGRNTIDIIYGFCDENGYLTEEEVK